MNKRNAVLALLNPAATQPYVPAAFFIHFDPAYHFGQPAVAKHLDFFRHTDMDLVKIQYETRFPYQPEIQRPTDWDKLTRQDKAFFQPQLEAVAGLVAAAKDEAIVVMTLYSPFMCCRQASNGLIVDHLAAEPEKAKIGLEIAADNLRVFVQECVRLGVDGFYHSTQGGEQGRFDDRSIFTDYIKPSDLALMNEIANACHFNILHVCDHSLPYDDLAPFVEYPGHIINCNPQVGSETLSGQAIAALFGRPYMGGLDRLGVIATGSKAAITDEVTRVIAAAPAKFLLAADCTLPDETSWDNIQAAIAAAHAHPS